MKEIFEVAGGSVAGTRHVKAGKNNQDAFYWFQDFNLTVAVAADGCGSGKFSEVGAQIGARIFIDSFVEIMRRLNNMSPFLGTISIPLSKIRIAIECVRREMLRELRRMADRMAGEPAIVKEYFLFTLVGLIITPEYSATFYIGDGVICRNGAIIELGPYSNNQPPYLSYSLYDRFVTGFSATDLTFNVSFETQTSNIQSILIGTDGVMDLVRAEKEKIPGREEFVGPLSQFWDSDLYFKNPDAVRRRLAVLNRESAKIDWGKKEVNKKEGLLPDDTTLIVIRRKEIGSSML